MIPNEARAESKAPKGRRARRRSIVISGVVTALVCLTVAVVVLAVTSGGGRAGTLSGADGISSFDPTSGIVNAEVHIVGSGFTGATDVRFNGVAATSFNVISDTEIATLVPEGATKGPITVVVPDGDIVSADDFRPGAPIIDGFAPSSAAAGAVITIAGSNLRDVKTVRINGVQTPATNATDDTVQAIVPNNASSGLVSVVTDATNAASETQITITSPSISDISPHFGAPGSQVTITGANLGSLTGVQFNGTPGGVVSRAADGSSAVVTVPPSFTEGPLTLVGSNGQVVSDDSFGTGPLITAISPTTASVGSTVTITGKYLKNTSLVSFSGMNDIGAAFTVVSDTQLSVVVPDAAGSGPITVVSGGATTSAASITIAGRVTSFAPEIGPAGTTVTVYGTGFTGATSVRFNGVASGTIKVLSDTKVTATVPTAATSGPITVVTSAGTLTSADSFTVGAVPAIAPSYDRNAPAPAPITADPAAPAGGTDFSKQQTVKIAGITFTGMTAQAAPTTTTLAATTTTRATTTAAPTTTITATTTTLPGATTTAPTSTSTPANTTVAPTTTIPQTPYSGTATIAIGTASTFLAKVTYTDPLNWSITPNTTSLSVTIPMAGKTMTVSTLTGSIVASGGNITWGLKGVGAATALIASKFTMNAGSVVYFTGTCPLGFSKTLCKEGSGPFARIDGSSGTTGLAAVVGNIVPSQTGMAYQAVADLNSKVFNLDASYPAGTMATIRDGRLRIAYKDAEFAKVETDVAIDSGSVNNGLDIVVTGKSHVDVPYLGGFNPPSIAVWYLDGGSMLTFKFPIKRVIGEASMGSATFVTGHGSPVQATIGGEPRQLSDGAWVFVGSMRMPSYMQRAFKVDSGEVLAVATMTGNGFTEVKAMFRTPIELPKIPYVETSFEGFEAGLRFNESNPDLSVEIFASASGTIKLADNAPFAVALEIAFSFGKEFSWSVALTGSGTEGRSVWPDMFGVKDFDLDKFSVEATFVGFSLAGVGLAGSGSLPGKLLEYMGATDGLPQPASFVVNLSALDPCLEVTAGTPDNASPLFSIPPNSGAISINYFRISASPNGCMVGVFDVPAGVVIAEKGTFFGIKKDYLLAFNPNPTGPTAATKSPSFYGWDISSTSADKGSIKFKYKLTWGAGGWNPMPYFYLDGLLKLGDNNEMQVHGGCAVLGGIPNCYAKGFGTIDLGLGLSADMAVDAQGIGLGTMTVAAVGDINIFGLKFSLAGSFTSVDGAPLGFDFSATADLPGKSALLDKLSVRLGFGIRQTVALCKTSTGMLKSCTKWVTDPLFSLAIEGNTGGLMKVVNGAADAFGAPPAPSGGRYKLRAAWEPTMTSISFGGTTSFSLGSLGTVSPSLNFSMCLTKDCFGRVSANFDITFRKAGKSFSFSDIDLGEDWNFAYSGTTSASFYESGKIGDSWGGLKGTISGSVTLGVNFDSSPFSVSFTVKASLNAKAYIGAGGDWNSVGSVGVSFDSDSGDACIKVDGTRLCV